MHTRIQDALIDLVSDCFLSFFAGFTVFSLLRLATPIANWTVALVRRLGHLVQVEITDVDIRSIFIAAFRFLKAVVAQYAKVSLILTLVPLFDAFGRFNR